MQSTGHSSIHALSLRSTQGSAIVYVTGAPRSPVQWAAALSGQGPMSSAQVCVAHTWTVVSVCPNFTRRPVKGGAWLLILDVADTPRPVATPIMSACWSSAQHCGHLAHMRLGAVQQVAYGPPPSYAAQRGPPPRDPRRAVRAIRIRIRARAAVRPVHRLLLGSHPPADLPHAAGDGGRRLGARHPGHPAGQAGQEGVHGLRRRPCRTRPLDRRTAVGSRQHGGRQPHPGPGRQGARRRAR